jgi:hypothetical protein
MSMPFAGPVCRTIRGLMIVGAIIAYGAQAQAETLRADVVHLHAA